MKVKTSELSGAALNWAVGKCEGVVNGDALDIGFIKEGGYTPSTDWSQGGPIIEREKITLDVFEDGVWVASEYQEGPTPLVAAMRCYVASKLGDTVDIPEELQ